MAKHIKTDNVMTLAILQALETVETMREDFKNRWKVPFMKRETSRWDREKRRRL